MRVIDELFPNFVAHSALADTDGQAPAEPLFPEETAYVARAVAKRQREYALGRTCARHALASLAVAPCALPSLPDRSVAWPDGVWGSITHADGFVAAVAVKRAQARGIGIDAEVRGRVQARLWPSIATAREIAWFEGVDAPHLRDERATRLFSAKEAFYKAQYCVSRAWVGFHDVALCFDDAGAFEVELLVDVATFFARGTRFLGRETFTRNHVVTGVLLACEADTSPK